MSDFDPFRPGDEHRQLRAVVGKVADEHNHADPRGTDQIQRIVTARHLLRSGT